MVRRIYRAMHVDPYVVSSSSPSRAASGKASAWTPTPTSVKCRYHLQSATVTNAKDHLYDRPLDVSGQFGKEIEWFPKNRTNLEHIFRE